MPLKAPSSTAKRALPPNVIEVFVALGVLLYAAVGVAALLLDHNYLDYAALAHEPTHGQHWGIFLVEFGVGTTVAAVMITIFYRFAERGSNGGDAE